jgi:hypothetical protein
MRVDGQLIFNRMPPMLNTARAGFGLACLMDDLAERRLTRELANWCPPFAGYHLYDRAVRCAVLEATTTRGVFELFLRRQRMRRALVRHRARGRLPRRAR